MRVLYSSPMGNTPRAHPLKEHEMNTRFGLALLVALAALPPAPAAAEELARFFRTVGTGKVSAKPDLATARVGVESTAETPTQALSANTAAMTKTLAAIRKAGIKPEDVETGYLSVGAVRGYEYGPRVNQASGYRASNSVTITVRDLAQVGAILDQVIAAGANNLGSVGFSVAKPQPLHDDAMRRALADSRRRAEVYAASNGLKLGRLMQVDEAASGPGDAVGNEEVIAVPGSAEVPVAPPASVDFSASVTATWEVQP
jgi:uncharacterized protein YggE